MMNRPAATTTSQLHGQEDESDRKVTGEDGVSERRRSE